MQVDMMAIYVPDLNFPFMAEAVAYAEEHWPEELILDDWKGVRNVLLDDLSKLNNLGRPHTMFTGVVTLSRDWNDLTDDDTKPLVELFDDAIGIFSTDQFISSELWGGRGGGSMYYCAHCGGCLGVKKCTACGMTFSDDGYRTGWGIPMPPKLIKQFRDRGHQFALDPERLLPR